MTTPIPLACPDCRSGNLAATYQVLLTAQAVDGAFTSLHAAPSDAGDFFVSLECTRCGYVLDASGDGRTQRGELRNYYGQHNTDPVMVDAFVALADRFTEFLSQQTITVELPKETA